MTSENKAIVKFDSGNIACLCNECLTIVSYGDPQCNVARYCEECYNKLYRFVRFIATDYLELSHDKVRIQRDDYIRRARKILEDPRDE